MRKMAIFGATGAVGMEAIRVLEARDVPLSDLRLFASAKSVEQERAFTFRGTRIMVEDLARADYRGIDIAIFSVGSAATKIYAPRVREQGCIVVDNSSAYRLRDDVPLVVPEINAHALHSHRGLIANPNCTTAITLMALFPLHRIFDATRISVTSYQAASGAGNRGLYELQAQLVSHHGETRVGDGRLREKMHSGVFPYPIALNVFPHIGSFNDIGSTDEEMKVLNEGRKILGHASLRASATCVRVTVERVHCMDVLAEFERPVDVFKAHEALRQMPGLDVYEGASIPTPLQYAGKDNCAVARVRVDQAFDNSLRFWVLGDQLLKGAALNAVQIAELLL